GIHGAACHGFHSRTPKLMLLDAGRESPDEASIAIRVGADRAGPSPRTRCHQKIRWQAQARTTARGVSTRVTLSCHECTGSQYPALGITEFSTTIRTSANLENDANGPLRDTRSSNI